MTVTSEAVGASGVALVERAFLALPSEVRVRGHRESITLPLGADDFPAGELSFRRYAPGPEAWEEIVRDRPVVPQAGHHFIEVTPAAGEGYAAVQCSDRCPPIGIRAGEAGHRLLEDLPVHLQYSVLCDLAESALGRTERPPVRERAWDFLFPDCIEALMEERGHGEGRRNLDETLAVYPRYNEFVSLFIGEAAADGNHDLALYGLFRLKEMGFADVIERVHLPMNLEAAWKDGDDEAITMTLAFAEQHGLRSRSMPRTGSARNG